MAQQRGRRDGGSRGAGARDARGLRADGRQRGADRAAGRSAAEPRAERVNRAGGTAVEHRARLRAVVEPVVVDAGYDLEDLAVSRVGRRHLVRIAVDSDEGVDLDAIADLSRRISSALDEAEAGGDELIAGEYELEVGSPGVDRPLTEPRHWRRNVGRLVQVRAGNRQVTARVTAADDGGVTLDAAGTAEHATYAGLGPGRVQVEFKRVAELDDDGEDLIEDEEGEDEE